LAARVSTPRRCTVPGIQRSPLEHYRATASLRRCHSDLVGQYLGSLGTKSACVRKQLIHVLLTNHVDALHQGDVLPHLCFTSDGRHNAYLLLSKGVDNRAFACVRVTDHTNRNLLAIAVERRELTKKGDEGTLAEAVVDIGVEGKSGEFFAQMSHPSSLYNCQCCPSIQAR
jgi:hypothetical protein